MKRKKIYAGTLALALSIGALAPIGGENFSSLAYAAESADIDPSTDETTTNESGGQTDGSDKTGAEKQNNQDIDLNSLIGEESNVKNSTRYKNASEVEKNDYIKSIQAARGINDDASEKETNQLIDNILAAKKNLGGSSFNTYEQREGLSSTIAIAEKLLASIKDNTNVKQEDKDKLASAITSAKNDEKDVNKSKDDINSTNNNLAQTIDDIIEKNNLEANNSALTYDEIEKISPSDNASYGKAYKNLGDLINSIKDFSEKDNYKNLSSKEQENLTNAANQAARIYNDLNSNTSQLNEAYSNLNRAYNNALSSIDAKDTEVSRLKAQIKEKTSNDPAELNQAGNTAKLSYNNAKANANTIANKEDATVDELKKALNNLNLARLALAPVKTQRLDDNQSQKSPIQTLNDLISDAKNYKNEDAYKSASDEAKKSYNDAITAAQSITSKDNSTDQEINAAISKIKEAKDNLKTSSNKEQEETSEEKLKRLLDDANRVIKHLDYDKLPQQYRDNLKKAIEKSENAETEEEIRAIISELESVFKNKEVQELLEDSIKIDNKETLEELLDLAKKVKEHNEYKNVGYTQRENLDKAIVAASSALKSGNEADIEVSRTGLVNALNQSEVKPIADLIRLNAKTDDPSYVKELKDLMALANKVKNHPDYSNVSEDTKRWLDDILIDSESYLKNGDKELIQSVTDRLKGHLNHEELRPIVQKIQEAEEETIDPTEIINKIIANDGTLKKSEKYRRAQKSLKEAYNKALEEASDLIKNNEAKEEDLKSASNKLVEAANALDGDKYQARLKALKDDFNSKKYDISDKAKRSELEEKIRALENDDATMDDLLAVEKELKNATAVTGTSQPVQGTTTTTPVSGTTTTTTPVTTTKQVPKTVNPGSIVRTGIKSLVGVAVVLVVALGAFALTGKNKKNQNEKTQRRDNDEIK